jgi:NAD dependent epimerase/dehydratase family enzyme
VLNRPALLNVPGRAVRAVLGEVADAMLLQSIRARPRKLQDTGYAFRHPALGNALRHLLGKVR